MACMRPRVIGLPLVLLGCAMPSALAGELVITGRIGKNAEFTDGWMGANATASPPPMWAEWAAPGTMFSVPGTGTMSVYTATFTAQTWSIKT